MRPNANTLKTVMTFASERDASAAGEVVAQVEEFADFPFVIAESGADWTVEWYDDGVVFTNATLVADLLTRCNLVPKAGMIQEIIPVTDWVAETQKSLSPVRTGRFLIHGSHDRHKASSTNWAIEIDAGRAFGTAHHGTTRGCLRAIDRISSYTRPHRILDLGTGSGVLAIAAAKACQHRAHVLAVDIDPVSVTVARENCLRNGVKVTVDQGNGVRPALPQAGFDLVIANILAKPLITLAPAIRAALAVEGRVILSGFLDNQAREVVCSYLARGFDKIAVDHDEGWTTAVLVRVC